MLLILKKLAPMFTAGSNLLFLNYSTTEFLLIVGVFSDKHLTFSNHILALSKLCLRHMRYLKWIRNTIHQTTACTIATALNLSEIGH